jgi:cobalt/nickel transport system permease protein
MGFPALAAYAIFKYGTRLNFKGKYVTFAAIGGGVAVALTTLLLFLTLLTVGEDPRWMLTYVVVPHMIVLAIEAVVSGAFVQFIYRVKPDILQSYVPKEVSA